MLGISLDDQFRIHLSERGRYRGFRDIFTTGQLHEAAEILSSRPEAMQLRYLGALGTIAGEKSSTIVFPFPVEFGRFFENFSSKNAAD